MAVLENKDMLVVELTILRRKSSKEKPYWQTIKYETMDWGTTVASALLAINDAGDYLDISGKVVSNIIWECSCLQKKCGACAMIIDGRPRLACESFLRTFAKKGKVKIEPLRKFPVIADLAVDRSILFENLKLMELWANEEAKYTDRTVGQAYEASRCLQCGCCLEACPNFAPGESFFGAAGFVPANRLLSALSGEEQERIRKQYIKHGYTGCGKSLACALVCPAEIPIEKLLINSNKSVLKMKKRKV